MPFSLFAPRALRGARDHAERAREAGQRVFHDEMKSSAELNFKFYSPATNNLAGISDEAAAFLEGFF